MGVLALVGSIFDFFFKLAWNFTYYMFVYPMTYTPRLMWHTYEFLTSSHFLFVLLLASVVSARHNGC